MVAYKRFQKAQIMLDVIISVAPGISLTNKVFEKFAAVGKR